MAVDNSQSHGMDLERTDRLPLLEGADFDDDVEDDAERMEFPPVVASPKPDFPRPSGLDLPSLAESVRSVEERIARQNAEFEALNRAYEKARDAEAAAVLRANSVGTDLAGVRSALEAEQTRTRDMDKALAEKNALLETTRGRVEEVLREAERHQSEARTLRDTLAARDTTLAQTQHSLGERDAQLSALQREHAHLVPALEERARAAQKLDADLSSTREILAAMAVELTTTQRSVADLSGRVKTGDDALVTTRRELSLMKTQATSYLERLRTRDWRRGFDLNLFRELDAKIGAVQDDRGALQSERDQLRQRVAELESQLAARDESIAKLQAVAAQDLAARNTHQEAMQKVEQSREGLKRQIDELVGEKTRLVADVASRDERLGALRAAAAERELAQAEQAAKLQAADEGRGELTRRIEELTAEVARSTAELASREESVARLRAAATAQDEARATQELTLQQVERACSDLTDQIASLERERKSLNARLAMRDQAVDDAIAAGRQEAQRGQELLAAAQREREGLAAQIQGLQADLKKRDDEMAVLVANLQQARRPLEPMEAELKRLTEELAAKVQSIDQANEENRDLRASLERARGALEEREFLIRRLERSESNNANVLGRIQTSIERLGAPLGAPTGSVGSAAVPLECTAELIRTDGQHNTSHLLARRTRIGRAQGCEVHIESSSVSRHHALVLMSSRDVIIEDLNSTNGLLVNGRKVSRQLLNDGDVLTIGEAQFRLSVKFVPRTLEAAAPAGGAPSTNPS